MVKVSLVTTACKTVTLFVPLSTICTNALSLAARAPVTTNASAAAPPTVVTWLLNLITALGVIPAANLARVTLALRIFTVVIALLAIVTAPDATMVASPDIATAVGTVPAEPTIISPLGKAANLENAIAAPELISAFTITPAEIAVTPVFEITTSPVTVTAVATLPAEPTNI